MMFDLKDYFVKILAYLKKMFLCEKIVNFLQCMF